MSGAIRTARRPRARLGWAGVVGATLVTAFLVVAVAGSLHGDPLALDAEPLLPPDGRHPFGTDALGRDLLARTGHGAATSAWIAVASVGAATLAALPLGVLIGWFHRRPAASLLRWTIELAQVVPPFVLVVVLLGVTADTDHGVLGVGLTPTSRLVLSLAVAFTPFLTRVVRSATLAELGQDYVEGLRLLGVRRREILLGEVVPNLLPGLAVQVLLALSIAVFAEGGLSYLGLGVPAPAPTLGNLIAEAGTQLLDDAWWYALIPGLVLVAGITGVNLLADVGTDRLLGHRPPTPDEPVAATPLHGSDPATAGPGTPLAGPPLPRPPRPETVS